MKNEESEKLEDSLRQISPAGVPGQLMERLRAAKVARPVPNQQPPARVTSWASVIFGWRGWTFAGAAAAVTLFVWVTAFPLKTPETVHTPGTGLKANAVQVGHSLVASFDTVAQMPDGEPVRFRCRQWQDQMEVHDDVHGVVITKNTPRLEVIPVGLETY